MISSLVETNVMQPRQLKTNLKTFNQPDNMPPPQFSLIHDLKKNIFSVDEAANIVGVTKEVIIDFIECGDLAAVGSEKNLIKSSEMKKFIGEEVKLPELYETPGSEILFCNCFINYLKTLKGGVSNRTFGNHLDITPHILEELGQYKMSEINRTVLRTFINGLTLKQYTKQKNGIPNTYYSQSTINKIFDLLHGFIIDMSDAEGPQLLKLDFMAKLEKPVLNKHLSEKEQVFTDDEIRNIFAAIKGDKMISCWIHVLADTGVRPSEALALKFSDVNFENGTINVFRTLSKRATYDVEKHKRISPYKPIFKDIKNEVSFYLACLEAYLLRLTRE